MCEDFGFTGFGETNDGEAVEEQKPEEIRAFFMFEQSKAAAHKRKEEERTASHLRRVASWLLGGSLATYVVLIILGVSIEKGAPADTWWTAAGPIVGYLVRTLFDGGNSKNENKE